MNIRRIILAGLCVTALACGKDASPPGGPNAECATNADCEMPYSCNAGRCSLADWQICAEGATRCNGDFVETCRVASGASTWEAADAPCETGCGNGECRTSVCRPLKKECTYALDESQNKRPGTATIKRCNETGTGWETFLACPYGCDVDSESPVCLESECEPFSTTCNPDDSTKLFTCNRYGVPVESGVGRPAIPLYTESSCPNETTCVGGRCVDQVCVVNRNAQGAVIFREERCNGNTKERCNDAQTGFEPVEICNLGCDYDDNARTATCGIPGCRTGAGANDFAVAGETRCDPTNVSVLQTCNERGTGWNNSNCWSAAGPAICVEGRCATKVCGVTRVGTTVTAREQRCNGLFREECADSQAEFRSIEACDYGCFVDNADGLAKCVTPSCEYRDGQNPDQRCTTSGAGATAATVLEQCNAYGVYEPVQFCPALCTQTGTTAACNAPTCTPLTSRCATEPGTNLAYVEICRADGSGFDRAAEPCAQGCDLNGAGSDQRAYCRVMDADCAPGALRCQQNQAQACVRLANGATEWRLSEQCLGTCNNGVCDDAGACGCAGGAAPDQPACGVPDRQSVNVKMLAYLTGSSTSYPCDALSRFLIYTEPLTDAAGQPVADGTLVTFTHDGIDSLWASADADPAAPGLQRPTLRGRARALLSSPQSNACIGGRSIRVTASVTGACRGSATFPFNAAQPTRYVYVAEDFSTTRSRDWTNTDVGAGVAGGDPVIRTSVTWDTARGGLSAKTSHDAGTGSDGDFTVGDATETTPPPVNLSETGHIRAFHVLSIGANDVSTEAVLPTFAPGDEVLLANIWGLASATGTFAGTYEFKKVASVATGRVVFTEPVLGQYAPSHAAIRDNRVIIQRVPHFNNVTVLANGTLTMFGPQNVGGALTTQAANAGSGIMAFRTKGTLRVIGKVTMNDRGLPPGFQQNGVTTTSLNRLRLGGPGGASFGGGVVHVAATKLSFRDQLANYANTSEITAIANGPGARGGVVFVGTNTLEVGALARTGAGVQPHLRATGPGGNGNIRVDYVATDATQLHYANPSNAANFFSGQNGPLWALSNVVFREGDASQANIRNALVMGVIGGAGQTQVIRSNVTPAPQMLAGFTLEGFAVEPQPRALPADPIVPWLGLGAPMQPTNFRAAEQPQIGKVFRWRMQVAPQNDQPHELLGFGIRLVVN